MKRLILLCVGLLPLAAFGQNMVLKTNLLHDATTTMNLGIEARLGGRSTLDIPVSYNPWRFSNYRQAKLLMIQPELRFWLCEAFNGHFFGLHLHAGQANTNNLPMKWGIYPQLRKHNYQGTFYGAGISWGYQWILSDRWGLELNLGGGYARVKFDRYDCVKCGEKNFTGTKNYWGPTRAGLSLVYSIF